MLKKAKFWAGDEWHWCEGITATLNEAWSWADWGWHWWGHWSLPLLRLDSHFTKHWSVTGLRSLRHEPCFFLFIFPTYCTYLCLISKLSVKLMVLQVLTTRHTRSSLINVHLWLKKGSLVFVWFRSILAQGRCFQLALESLRAGKKHRSPDRR